MPSLSYAQDFSAVRYFDTPRLLPVVCLLGCMGLLAQQIERSVERAELALETSRSARTGGGMRAAGVLLGSGEPTTFSLPQSGGLTVFAGDSGFQVVVPQQGSTTLEIQLTTVTPGIDIDLYRRIADRARIQIRNDVGVWI